MARQILCSTGAIVSRMNGRDHRLIMKYRPLLRCDGMEFMMYESWYDRRDEIARELAASGIAFPAMHVEKTIGDRISRGEPGDEESALRDFGWNCEMANAIGAKQLVMHLWGGVASDYHIERNYGAYGRLAGTARAHGLELTVENVVCGLADPMTRLAEMRSRFPGRGFTIDTKMSAFHGQMPLFSRPEWAWLWTERRVRHLHVNDYRGGVGDWASLRTLFIGDGQIDFVPFFKTAGRYGYDGSLTCECTAVRQDGSVNIDRLNDSLDAVRALAALYLDGQN